MSMRSVPFSKKLITLIGCLFFLLLSPSIVKADDICCKCTPQNMTDAPTSCFTVISLQNPLDCTTLPTEQKMSGFTCEKDPLKSAQCKKSSTSGGGICSMDPQPAKATRTGETTVSAPEAQPKPTLLPNALQFNTPIPGFVAPTDMGLLFASYMIAIYRYMISIAIFVTTVMFIWGAFRYLVGSSMGNVSRGKEIMKDSVIGLLLVLSANLILRTINPALISLPNLDISEISTQLYQPVDTAFNAPVGSRGTLKLAAIQQAKATNIPEIPCMAKATIDRESGGNIAAINHNEDFNSSAYAVKSRQKYLGLGHTFTNVTFDPIQCSSASCQVASVPKNGDKLDLNSPPSYGLDLQYSHALGAAQAAIFPGDKPCSGKEDQGPGHIENTPKGPICLTIPQLMSADGAAAVIVAQNVRNLRSYPNNIAQALGRYVGNIDGNHPESQARFAIFTACMARGIESYPDYNGSMGGGGGSSSGGGGLVMGSGIKVLLIGDSLAHGLSSYLRNMIQSGGASFDAVYEDGMPIGAYVGGGKKVALLDAALAIKPNYILVSLGTNDEYISQNANSASASNLATAQKNYNALIDKLSKSGATVYWILPPTLPDIYAGGNTKRVNGPQIEDILKKSAYFDSTQVSLPRPANEIHPGPDGYKAWAQAIFTWLTK